MLPWIHVSAMNDGVNMVFIDTNSNWSIQFHKDQS